MSNIEWRISGELEGEAALFDHLKKKICFKKPGIIRNNAELRDEIIRNEFRIIPAALPGGDGFSVLMKAKRIAIPVEIAGWLGIRRCRKLASKAHRAELFHSLTDKSSCFLQ